MNQGTDYSLSVTGLKCGQGVRLFRFGPLEEVASRVWVVAASLSPTTNVKFQTLKTVKYLPMRFVQQKNSYAKLWRLRFLLLRGPMDA